MRARSAVSGTARVGPRSRLVAGLALRSCVAVEVRGCPTARATPRQELLRTCCVAAALANEVSEASSAA